MRHSSTAIKNNDAEEYLMKKMMFMIFFLKQSTNHWAECDPICVVRHTQNTDYKEPTQSF